MPTHQSFQPPKSVAKPFAASSPNQPQQMERDVGEETTESREEESSEDEETFATSQPQLRLLRDVEEETTESSEEESSEDEETFNKGGCCSNLTTPIQKAEKGTTQVAEGGVSRKGSSVNPLVMQVLKLGKRKVVESQVSKEGDERVVRPKEDEKSKLETPSSASGGCEQALGVFKPNPPDLQVPVDQPLKPTFPTSIHESVSDERWVASRLAENSLFLKDSDSLKNVDPERLMSSLIWHSQQMSSMLTSLHSHSVAAAKAEAELAAESKQVVVTESNPRAQLIESQLKALTAELEATRKELQEQKLARCSAERLWNGESFLRKLDKENLVEARKEATELMARVAKLEKADFDEPVLRKDKAYVMAPEPVLVRKEAFDKCRREIELKYPHTDIDWSTLSLDSSDEEELLLGPFRLRK